MLLLLQLLVKTCPLLTSTFNALISKMDQEFQNIQERQITKIRDVMMIYLVALSLGVKVNPKKTHPSLKIILSVIFL